MSDHEFRSATPPPDIAPNLDNASAIAYADTPANEAMLTNDSPDIEKCLQIMVEMMELDKPTLKHLMKLMNDFVNNTEPSSSENEEETIAKSPRKTRRGGKKRKKHTPLTPSSPTSQPLFESPVINPTPPPAPIPLPTPPNQTTLIPQKSISVPNPVTTNQPQPFRRPQDPFPYLPLPRRPQSATPQQQLPPLNQNQNLNYQSQPSTSQHQSLNPFYHPQPLPPPTQQFFNKTSQNPFQPPRIQQTASAAPAAPNLPRSTPIILREKEKWSSFNQILLSEKVNYSKASNTSDGIKFWPVTPSDFRKAVKILTAQNLQFHTFPLPEERNLRIVLRGVPEHYSIEFLTNYLTSLEFTVNQISRMQRHIRDDPDPSNHFTIPMPLVVLILPNTPKNQDIYRLQDIEGCHIIVEHQNRPTSTAQCHRCQKYGHTQRNCRAAPKCVKCAADHLTTDCTKPYHAPTKCANCGGNHCANFRGCPLAPKSLQQPPILTAPPQSHFAQPTMPLNYQPSSQHQQYQSTPYPTYAQTAATQSPTNILAAFGEMKNLLHQFSILANTLNLQ